MRVWFAAASGALVAVIACGSPTSPTNGVTPDFITATGMNVIAVGSSARMTATAFARGPDPTRISPVTADISSASSWSSDNPAVASIGSGIIVGRAAGSTTVRVGYMGREYDLPVSVVGASGLAQQFAGTWSGVMNRSCVNLVGNTRSCYLPTGQPSVSPEDLSITLTNVNGALQGTIDIGGGMWTHVTGPVTAGLDASGRLVIGGVPRVSGEEVSEQLRDWSFTFSGGQLIGSGTSDSGFVNIYGVVWKRTTYTDINLR